MRVTTATRRSDLRRRRGEVRELILAAAARSLRERPFRELSVEDLMRSAELTRTLFYRHFDDLADLVVRLLDDASSELFEYERQLAEAAMAGEVSIEAALEPAVRTLAREGPLLRAVAEAASTDERIERGYRSLVDRFAGLIEGYLRLLTAQGRVQVADPAETARALNLMNLAYLLDSFGSFGSSEPRVTPEVALRTLSEIWAGTIPNA